MKRDEPALSLALLRIVVPGLLLVAPGFREGARVAGWDAARFVVPEGLGWFVRSVPISPGIALGAQVVTAFAAGCAMVGVLTRPALLAATLGAFYLFSIAQLTGFVWHDMHLLWLTVLLAVSPCDDVLAWDAKLPADASGPRYAPALWVARALLACVYFFPGLHKILGSGLAWALSDNLRWQVYWKWLQHGIVPSIRIDRVPGLLEVGGLAVLCFELSFPLLVLFRRTRLIAVVAGISFHLLSQIVFKIPFASLWLCYVVLVDPRRVAARALGARTPSGAEGSPRPWSRALFVVASAALISGAIVQGARGQMRSYPFACYPTFEWNAGPLMPDLGIVATDAEGRETEIVHARDARGYRTQRQWGEVWSLAGVWGTASSDRLSSYLATVSRTEPARSIVAHARLVRFYRYLRSVVPEERGAPPAQRILLGQIRREAATP